MPTPTATPPVYSSSGGAILPQAGAAQTNQSTGGNAVIPTASGVASPTLPSTINSSNLGSTPAINVGTPPTSGLPAAVTSGGATVASVNQQIAGANAATQDTTGSQDLTALFNQYMGSQTPPTSGMDIYNQDQNSPLGQQTTAAQQASLKSHGELNALNAQIAGLTYNKDTVIPTQDQQTGLKSGTMSAGAIAGQTAADQRQALLQLAPLQFQALQKQAEVTNNDALYTAAQNQMDKIFSIQQTDAQNAYNYKNSVIDKVYAFATSQEQAKLDAQKTANANAFTQQQDAIKNAQALAQTAITNGQSDLAAKLMGLDPHSSTYQQDVAAVAKQINVQPKVSSSIQDIGGRKVQIVTDEKGNIVKQVDLGASTATAPKPAGYTSFTPTEKTALLGAGETSASINQLESDINQYGPQQVLDNGTGLSDATKQWIQDTYGVKPTPSPGQSNGIFGLGFFGL